MRIIIISGTFLFIMPHLYDYGGIINFKPQQQVAAMVLPEYRYPVISTTTATADTNVTSTLSPCAEGFAKSNTEQSALLMGLVLFMLL